MPGASLEPLTRLDKGETSHVSPELLPGGKAVLFSTTGANPQVAVQSLSSGNAETWSRVDRPLAMRLPAI